MPLANPLGRAALAAALSLAAAFAAAQDYPSKPIRMIIPTAPGGGTDLLGRVLAEGMQKQLGQPVVLDHRAGASGQIAGEALATAPADGHMLLMTYAGVLTMNPALFKSMKYDPVRDFAPVAVYVDAPNLLVVNPGLKATTVAELVDLARAKPNTLTFASAGKGTTAHLSMEMLKAATGITMTHVPYNTPQLLADVVGGHTSMIVYPYQALKPLVESGKLRALATMGEKRAVWMPDAPTMIEAGYPGFTWASWFAIFGPAQLPREIVLKVAAAYEGVLKDPALAASLAATGSEAFYGGAEALAETTRAEIERVRRVVQSAKITFDE